MKNFSLKEIASLIQGTVRGNVDFPVRNVVLSQDRMAGNTVFFNLQGRELDCELLKKYNPCAVVCGESAGRALPDNVTRVEVTDIEKSFWRFVEYYRSLFDIPVVAVTGTCGKTTTKDMIAHILSMYFRTVSTYKSINGWRTNLRYLIEIDQDTQAAVIETAVAYPGDLLESCRYFRPRVGIITNIGIDHLSGCKTFENYLRAKADMLEGLGYTGTLILNADDDNIDKIDLSRFKGRTIYFSIKGKGHFMAEDIKYNSGGMEFSLWHQSLCHNIRVSGHGVHVVYNALAAIAAAHELGIGIREAGGRLETFRQPERHLQILPGINGSTIIDDTWSANPTSTETALDTLRDIARGKRTIVVLGDMSLLGESEKELHSRMGDLVLRAGVDILVTVGDLAGEAAVRALQLGMSRERVFSCSNTGQAYNTILPYLNPQCTVLLKKSMKGTFGNLIKKLTL